MVQEGDLISSHLIYFPEIGKRRRKMLKKAFPGHLPSTLRNNSTSLTSQVHSPYFLIARTYIVTANWNETGKCSRAQLLLFFFF